MTETINVSGNNTAIGEKKRNNVCNLRRIEEGTANTEQVGLYFILSK